MSPRIVSAQVVGSRGSVTVDGATLRARLGLFDTWAYFTAISARGGAVRSLRAASEAPRPFAMAARPAVGVLRGTVVGDHGSSVTIQRRDGGWVEVGHAPLERSGRFAWTASRRGTYRAVVDGAAGPAVRVG